MKLSTRPPPPVELDRPDIALRVMPGQHSRVRGPDFQPMTTLLAANALAAFGLTQGRTVSWRGHQGMATITHRAWRIHAERHAHARGTTLWAAGQTQVLVVGKVVASVQDGLSAAGAVIRVGWLGIGAHQRTECVPVRGGPIENRQDGTRLNMRARDLN